MQPATRRRGTGASHDDIDPVLSHCRALLDLPGDLEDIVRVLSESTGAEIYAVATWKWSESSFGVHE